MSSRTILSLRLPKATKDALYGHGYETVRDLLSATPTSIARGSAGLPDELLSIHTEVTDLNISNVEAEEILQQAQNPSTQNPDIPLTQSAATIVKSTRKLTTRWPPLDKLLKGGLVNGHVLEISGPPGSPKETIAIDIAASVLQAGEKVIFVDCQNMTSESKLCSHITSAGFASHLASLHFIRLLNATEVMTFLHSVNGLLDSIPRVSLLVLNSLSFPFSTLPNPRLKPGILKQVGHILTRISAVRNLTIIITSQLAMKVIKEDGSPGTFDEGARGMMTPQLGASYLSSGRSHRVILSLETPFAGSMYLLPSDSQVPHANQAVQQEAYSFPPTSI